MVTKVFNVGTGGYVRINQLWEMICRIAGFNIEPKYEQSRPGDILESVANIDQIKLALGFKPEYSFEKGLEITFKWYKSFA